METTNNTETSTDTEQRIKSLAKHLGCEVGDITESTYGENSFDAEGGEYFVLTDNEADELAEREIRESIWAFNADFVASHTKNGLSDECIEAIKEIQGRLCEGASPVIEALIEDMDHFISDAISSDGRGHFISRYDGEENEEGVFYIYRTN
jgi:hypothetical protein